MASFSYKGRDAGGSIDDQVIDIVIQFRKSIHNARSDRRTDRGHVMHT